MEDIGEVKESKAGEPDGSDYCSEQVCYQLTQDEINEVKAEITVSNILVLNASFLPLHLFY